MSRTGLLGTGSRSDGSGSFSDMSGFLLRLRKTNAPIATAMSPAAAPIAMPAIAPAESVELLSLPGRGLPVRVLVGMILVPTN
jgi:hypothetical protein